MFAKVAGFIIGLAFGISGVATLLSYALYSVEISIQVLQVGAASTFVFFVAAILFVMKLRFVSSLLAGAIAGAAVSAILEFSGINLIDLVVKVIGF